MSRVESLQNLANILDEQRDTQTRLQKLRLRMHAIGRLIVIAALKLGRAIGLDTQDVSRIAKKLSLVNLADDVSSILSCDDMFSLSTIP